MEIPATAQFALSRSVRLSLPLERLEKVAIWVVEVDQLDMISFHHVRPYFDSFSLHGDDEAAEIRYLECGNEAARFGHPSLLEVKKGEVCLGRADLELYEILSLFFEIECETKGLAQNLLNSGSMAYALDVSVMFLLLAALALMVGNEERKTGSYGGHPRLHPVVLRRFRRVMKAQAIVGAIFVVSALPIFWTMTPIGYLRFTLWYSSFVILPAVTLRSVREKRRNGTAQSRTVPVA